MSTVSRGTDGLNDVSLIFSTVIIQNTTKQGSHTVKEDECNIYMAGMRRVRKHGAKSVRIAVLIVFFAASPSSRTPSHLSCFAFRVLQSSNINMSESSHPSMIFIA